MDWKSRYAQRVEMFRKNPLVTSVQFRPSRGLGAQAARRTRILDRIKRDWQLTVPPDILAFYDAMNGLELIWESTASSPYASRSVSRLSSLEVMFGGHWGMKAPTWSPAVFSGTFFQPWQEEDGCDLSLPKSCKHVEGIEGVSSDVGVVLGGDESVVYVTSKLDFHRLTLDLPAFLEHHLMFLGHSCWYYLFVERPRPWMLNSVHPDSMITLFPDMAPLLSARRAALGL